MKAKQLMNMFATVAKSAKVHYVLSDENATNRAQRRELAKRARAEQRRAKSTTTTVGKGE